MNGQIDWQAQQISHLVCSLAGQRCSEAWGTFSARTSQSITALTAWKKEEWRKEAADIPPSKAENDLCSTRQILALFRGQPWGDCWETGRSAYGPFRALRCHLELKLKLVFHFFSQSDLGSWLMPWVPENENPVTNALKNYSWASAVNTISIFISTLTAIITNIALLFQSSLSLFSHHHHLFFSAGLPVVRHAQLSTGVEQLRGCVARATRRWAVSPQDTISPGGSAALFTGVPVVTEHVVLVGRSKVGRALVEAMECLSLALEVNNTELHNDDDDKKNINYKSNNNNNSDDDDDDGSFIIIIIIITVSLLLLIMLISLS